MRSGKVAQQGEDGMPIRRLLLSEAQIDTRIEQIRSAGQAWQLRKALNYAIIFLDMAEDETVEDAFDVFKGEVKSSYGVDIDQRLSEFPALRWKEYTKSSSTDPNFRPGFTEKR